MLVVREPGRVAVKVKLFADFTVGREANNCLALSDPHVSRRHARFVEEDGRFRIVDRSSSHGVLVNGAASTDWLDDGDVIQIGRTLLTFRAESTVKEDRIAVRFRPDAGSPPESRRLRMLYQVSCAFEDSGDPDALLSKLLAAVLDVLGCERGLIGLTDGGAATARRIAQGRDGADVDQMVVSSSLIDTLLRGESILLHDPVNGPPTIVREGVRSAMGAPLRSGAQVLGFIYVADRARADRFAPEELEFLTALAQLTSAALERTQRQRRDLAVAEALRDSHPVSQLLGASEPMRDLRARVRKFAAAAHAPVLLRGESGTGKELVARAIHDSSPRARRAVRGGATAPRIPDSAARERAVRPREGGVHRRRQRQRRKFRARRRRHAVSRRDRRPAPGGAGQAPAGAAGTGIFDRVGGVKSVRGGRARLRRPPPSRDLEAMTATGADSARTSTTG